jgi:hypothetical protein
MYVSRLGRACETKHQTSHDICLHILYMSNLLFACMSVSVSCVRMCICQRSGLGFGRSAGICAGAWGFHRHAIRYTTQVGVKCNERLCVCVYAQCEMVVDKWVIGVKYKWKSITPSTPFNAARQTRSRKYRSDISSESS